MRFRPCIDLHGGKVKQIVGSTLVDDDPGRLQTNFVANQSSIWFAEQYRRDNLLGGHIIMLGPGNERAAIEALSAWPGGMQIGGGITVENASHWLEQGASHVIVTSWVFRDGRIDENRLVQLVNEVGKAHLVLDLSCRRKGDDYYIVTDRWQRFTEVVIGEETLVQLGNYCDEFLVHAADVEGKCDGIETSLAAKLGDLTLIPTTYAGGIRDLQDLETIRRLGSGKLDAAVGSGLDIFGGDSLSYADVVAYHNKHNQES